MTSSMILAQPVWLPNQAWKDPSEFHGCGSFAKESWMIFCRSPGSLPGMSAVHDIKLRAYLRWVATGKIQAEAAAKRRTAGLRKRKGVGHYLAAIQLSTDAMSTWTYETMC